MSVMLPKWLYSEWQTADVLRTRVWGSRRTILHVLCVGSLRGGASVWMIAGRGWCLTFGPEDGVAEGLYSGLESEPRTRHRTWKRPNGRAYALTYTPATTDVGEGSR